MKCCQPEFGRYLQQFSSVGFDREGSVIYGLWPDLTLSCLNNEWFEFARDNNGEPAISRRWGLGASIVTAIPEILRDFYLEAYSTALKTGKKWEHDYECSSPYIFRKFRQFIYPLDGEALLVVHSLMVDFPHPGGNTRNPAGVEEYEDENDIIHQCSHCRRCRNNHFPSRWDWIPFLVENTLPQVSHGLCPICFDYYYSKSRIST